MIYILLSHFHLFILYAHLQYVSSDPEDYQKEYENSLMYLYVDLHLNSILLNITIPPRPPKTTPTTTNVTEGGIMENISMNEENKGKERSNNKY